MSPVLNIDRVGRDTGRCLIFCLLPIQYEEIIRPYRLQQKNGPYLKYWPINRPISGNKSPDISPYMK